MVQSIGFVAFGCAVPSRVRTHDDPIFARARSRAGAGGEVLFEGLRERRVLGPDESVESLMVLAGQRALAAAGLEPAAIDRLYGYASVSEFLVPNGLYKVHHDLGLSPRAAVVPVNDGFTNFITGAALGWEAIASGRCRHVMINCGSGWTRNADYDADYAVVLGDGAGAAVLGPSERFTLVDFAEETYAEDDFYRGMNLKVRVAERDGLRHLQLDAQGLPVPTFEINEGGVRAFIAHGLNGPPRLVRSLLERHGVSRDRVAFVGHQGSRRLMDHWAQEIQPRQYLHTVDRYGDLTIASVPVTLATVFDQIETDYLVLAAPGPGIHFAALLIKR
jgi:3-oxoacyl-[acyl-carrier-protein] synthase-3